MMAFEMVQRLEDEIPSLHLVSEENRPAFMNALYWWYRDITKHHYIESPNIDDLLDAGTYGESYLEAVMDVVAGTIIDEEGWDNNAAESYGVAYEIIHCNWDEIVEELRDDIKKVFDSIQLFYSEGIVTEDLNGSVDWSAEVFHHAALQEVW